MHDTIQMFAKINTILGGDFMKKLEEYKSGEYIKMNDYKAFVPS